MVARLAHNQEVARSSRATATNGLLPIFLRGRVCMRCRKGDEKRKNKRYRVAPANVGEVKDHWLIRRSQVQKVIVCERTRAQGLSSDKALGSVCDDEPE